MAQFAPVWHRSRCGLVWLAPPNIQLEGCPCGKERPGRRYSSQGGKRHAGRRRLGPESRARCVTRTISRFLTFDILDFLQAYRLSPTLRTIFLLISRRYSSMLRPIFHRRFTMKLRCFCSQLLACVCYPLKDRPPSSNLPASFSNSTPFFT